MKSFTALWTFPVFCAIIITNGVTNGESGNANRIVAEFIREGIIPYEKENDKGNPCGIIYGNHDA